MEAKFLNSEIAQAEEAAEREQQQSVELLEALNRIAEQELRILALADIICELAIENAKLRVEVVIQKAANGNNHSG